MTAPESPTESSAPRHTPAGGVGELAQALHDAFPRTGDRAPRALSQLALQYAMNAYEIVDYTLYEGGADGQRPAAEALRGELMEAVDHLHRALSNFSTAENAVAHIIRSWTGEE